MYSGCIVFLFCLVIGGVERGESTGAGANDRSIRERYTALSFHVLRRERHRGYEKREPVRVELRFILYI